MASTFYCADRDGNNAGPTMDLPPSWFRIGLNALEVKFKPLKTDENEIKTLKITAMLFNFVFLCLFW